MAYRGTAPSERQQIKSTAWEICTSGSMSGMWKRGHGQDQ
jgi:hypothetical protein